MGKFQFADSQNRLREEACVSDAAVIERATMWANKLTQSEVRGPGDIDNAWRRLEHRYGIPRRAFWSLRYRRPNEIAASIYLRLQAAYQAECERHLKRLKHELEISRATAGINQASVAAVAAVVGQEDGGEEG